MNKDNIMNLFETPVKKTPSDVIGKYVELDGENFYRIENYSAMRPFFMSLVSHSDHWLFISSSGGLTAGRKNANSSLFPYYTDDKLTENSDFTGALNILKVQISDTTYLWEPFSIRNNSVYSIRRNLYKNTAGNKIIFEEINDDLQLAWQYSWQFSEKYGFVKSSKLTNLSDSSVVADILDGIQNILPYGINSELQSNRSNLGNAYKKSELEKSAKLGIFSLSSMIVDKAEPSEALKATTCWVTGTETEDILLSSLQLESYRRGDAIKSESEVKGEPGAYIIRTQHSLKPQSFANWFIIAEVNQDHSSVINLIDKLSSNSDLTESIVGDINFGTNELRKLVALADGLQTTGDQLSSGRHFSNVMFNIMRGGIFEEQYDVESADFAAYIGLMNNHVYAQFSKDIKDLPKTISYQDLLLKSKDIGHPDLIRLTYEYLPLSFSRRHGDPSRPWNQFSIETRTDQGGKARNYQGNWRDIFQNWEALAVSFPEFLPSMISKFVNASTIDGYNPYRITREGIDWEVIEPDDPWSYIGYWGDHQIIYLLKLLELSNHHQHELLAGFLKDESFVFANVPYRIRDYKDIVANPQDTIDYDFNSAERIERKVEQLGGDGKLVFSQEGDLIQANLLEKILLTLLTKLSNYVPDGGIWLNTQRPEWNDANNALVGNGVSMVTLYYMRRYLSFCLSLLESADQSYRVNAFFLRFFNGIYDVFKQNEDHLLGTVDASVRKSIIDDLGKVGEAYRSEVYNTPSNEKVSIDTSQIIDLCNVVRSIIDVCIESNVRADGLYHSYNLLQIEGSEARIERLYEMLEGQVAVLSSEKLSPSEVLELLNSLKASPIYREDQYSYMLYPNRQLPGFLEKNQIPTGFLDSSELAQKLVSNDDNSILIKDIHGSLHFNGDFHNANDLKAALKKLASTELADLAKKEEGLFLNQFEKIFNHRAFTGRSGTFFGYEGLGSIYWHMVSKLLLAVQENLVFAFEQNSDQEIIDRLTDHYYEIRAGIGINKPPELYGAFPTDPYSHTPFHKGAQQPGMTGQVKEDILSRWAELGVQVRNSKVYFKPDFLHLEEFLSEVKLFPYFDVEGLTKTIKLEIGQLAFTYCQVPVIYINSDNKGITLYLKNGDKEVFTENILTEKYSRELFSRTGLIERIEVEV